MYTLASIHEVVGFVHREKQSVDLDCVQAVYSLFHCIAFLALVLIHMHFISSSVLVYLEHWTVPAGEIGDKLVYKSSSCFSVTISSLHVLLRTDCVATLQLLYSVSLTQVSCL